MALTICRRKVGVILPWKTGDQKHLHLFGLSTTSRLNNEYLLNETWHRQFLLSKTFLHLRPWLLRLWITQISPSVQQWCCHLANNKTPLQRIQKNSQYCKHCQKLDESTNNKTAWTWKTRQKWTVNKCYVRLGEFCDKEVCGHERLHRTEKNDSTHRHPPPDRLD